MSNNRNRLDQVGLIISIVSVLVPISWFLIVDFLYGGKEEYVNNISSSAGILVIVCLVFLVPSVVSFFMVRGWKKVIPLIGVIILMILTAVSYITYGLKDLKW